MIDTVEQQYGIQIPSDTVRFLMNNSRGCPKEKGLKSYPEREVSRFISLDERDRINLLTGTKLLSDAERIYIPVAMDSGNGMYTLKYEMGVFRGIVYLRSGDREEEKLYSSWEEFLHELDVI